MEIAATTGLSGAASAEGVDAKKISLVVDVSPLAKMGRSSKPTPLGDGAKQ
jgi:hypothetical protein